MARFIGIVRGNRGEATRLGHVVGGLRTENNGWRQGVTVVALVTDSNEDAHHITLTNGSGNRIPDLTHIGTVANGIFRPSSQLLEYLASYTGTVV